ncbi:BamA/TamA family outer membrane protein [Mucilaginibacter sp. UR6-11]|uniref:BamA/TamA family outer membrane protein n=1 Tax=Mucilaginibacter sp. UR6-11 TaxID=1435644 RepID=UPI001E4A5A55|nr:BamA/TamA family outer membrane protein [Mucilaginibacter sp. UR6-11]MCC8426850.1 outer membrane protein assembly factor [Mucilaginibacter sp. UR6-11]
MDLKPINAKYYILKSLLLLIVIVAPALVFGQVGGPPDSLKADSLRAKKLAIAKRADNINHQYDFGDLTRNVIHPKRKADTLKKSSGITVVPNIAANPTIGAQIGIKAVAGRKLGNDPKTLLSVAATSASITSKGIIYFYLNHNVFTPGNKWNFQGNIVAAKTVTPDYGLGIGHDVNGGTSSEKVLADGAHKVYAIHSYYFNIREKVYKGLGNNFFAGAGLSFEVRRNITTKDTTSNATPSSVYNNEHGFPQDHYSANGFLFNLAYTTRDNPNRAYKGVYFDAGIRINQMWIGSTKNSVQVTTDFRKYVSLSAINPETVIAFWNWGSYLVSGDVPYLELPGTARDGAFRSGRGYTSQYFKGTQFNDTEVEFRFPILANKFLSGVTFASMQSANDEHGTKLFQVFQPGYGAGLRVLFNKATRTNLALDYAFGKYGNKGFFLNLNESF